MKKLLFLLLAALLAPLALAGTGAGAGLVDEYTTRVVLGQGTPVTFYATAAAAGSTGTETAITLTRSSGTSATTTGTSFVVTSGKRYRITSITVATRGHSTGTAQVTTFSLRVNTAGAVTTSSTPVIFQASSATVATASAWDRTHYSLSDGLEIAGDGTLQIGLTANATYTTNAPTWYVVITGYEY